MSFLDGLFSSGSSSGSGSGSLFGSILTDLGGAAQVGLGIYNETQGGPAVNTNVGGVYRPGTVAPGAAASSGTLFGFSITQIVIGVLLIAGVIFAVHFATK